MHPRVSLHQVAFLNETTAAFLAHCRDIGVQQATLVSPALTRPGGIDEARAAGVRIASINHPFAVHPDLEYDGARATGALDDVIEIAVSLGCPDDLSADGCAGRIDLGAGGRPIL